MKYEFMKNNRDQFELGEMCECLEVSPGGYYRWLSRDLSRRAREDQYFKECIQEVWNHAKMRYGYRPVYHLLKGDNINCGRDRTLRLMRELGIQGIQTKAFKPQVTDSKHHYGYSPNLTKVFGEPIGINQIWVADTTYMRIKDGFCYLATVMDLYSRKLIGWSVSLKNDTDLICQALRSAIWQRGGTIPQGVIHHSDRGSTYASDRYRRMQKQYGMLSSMSAKGNCYDNAAMESFYGRYKTSSVRKWIFDGIEEVRRNAFEYIEGFYNRFRKHKSLGYKSPDQIENEISPAGEPEASLTACSTTETKLTYKNN